MMTGLKASATSGCPGHAAAWEGGHREILRPGLEDEVQAFGTRHAAIGDDQGIGRVDQRGGDVEEALLSVLSTHAQSTVPPVAKTIRFSKAFDRVEAGEFGEVRC
ncbi:MAG: hypothetical protein R3E68_09675 [Burkholderiaceae bacterium]